MAFKNRKKATSSYEDPESLFRDQRNRTVEGLLSHQSDILRRYQSEAFDKPNVALELPTGSGKTLVGLLIAEFRRVTRKERVLYLCPTNQLVRQVCEQSERKYGLKTIPFTGRVRDYDPDDKVKYQTANTIAVAPYSALFNTNPFFDSPQLIILDDAHAAENYIASNWSIYISHRDDKEMYLGLLSVLGTSLPPAQLQRFQDDERDEYGVKWIEKIPTADLIDLIPQINAYLDEHTADTKAKYPWSLLHGHLEACHVYVSYDNILIRPYIPPSMTHEPFAGATQRVFMSATLGLGGDLERTTGIRTFHRLPIPVGWDKQGIGRRFFLFPELSLPAENVDPLAKAMVEKASRALILVPSDKRAEKYKTLFNDITVYSARDIETSKDAFISQENAVAVLANRYDGIDLLGDECRLLIIEGIPKAGNLQELFLMSRMASATLFNDRIRTRIIQAIGRCTRSATDYAAVIMIGEDFADWLIIEEKRSLFHPELQGELIFGAEQSQGQKADDFVANLVTFLEHGDQWDDVDADIREYRDEAVQESIPEQQLLFQVAPLEVDYQYAIWNEDYERCLELCQTIASDLSGDNLRGLRGFWYYLAASAAELAFRQTNNNAFATKATDLYRRASSCVPAVSWLRLLAVRRGQISQDTGAQTDDFLESNAERIEMLFDSRSYASPRRFERDVKEILDGLSSNDNSKAFEEAHRKLGEMLGFDSHNSDANAAPDPWWISNGKLCLVAEDKNDSQPDNSVSVSHVRQAASHPKWISDNVKLGDGAEIHTVMITPATKLHRDVPTYADEVGYWHLDDFREWARNAISVLRNLRSTFTGPGNISWRDQVRTELLAQGLDPKAIVIRAREVLLRNVEVE